MIGYLKGRVIKQNEHSIVVDVGGIGYVVYVNQSRISVWETSELELWIETVFREYHIELYGFETPSEQSAFLQLQKVPGVGPKMALTILSSFESLSELYRAIRSQNLARLKTISGVGAKLAARIVQELQNVQEYKDIENIESDTMHTALRALCALGYEASRVFPVLQEISKHNESDDAESYVRIALHRLTQPPQ